MGLAVRSAVMLAVLAVLALAGTGCFNSYGGGGEVPTKSIQDVLAAHTDAWLAVPGVVGTAIGTFRGRPAIHVFVERLTPEVEDRIPTYVDGYPVVFVESGGLKALEEP